MWRQRLKSLLEWRWFAAVNSVIVMGLVALLLSRRVDSVDLHGLLSRLRVGWLFAAILMGFLVVLCAALRTKDIYSREAGTRVPLLPTFRLLLVGLFMTYAAPIAVAADIARVGLFRLRFGIALDASARATVFDRLIGALGLIVAGLLTFFLQPVLTESRSLEMFQAAILGGACALVAAVLAVSWMPFDLRWGPGRTALVWVKRLGEHFKRPDFIVKQTGFALLQVGCSAATFWMVAKAVSLDIPMLSILAFAPLILFVNSLPFLYAGWGGRELITVVTFGALHVPSDEALLVSIGYGLVMLIVALPGAALWLARPTFRKAGQSAMASTRRRGVREIATG